MTPGDVSVRPRRVSDIPALATVLLAQQAETRYPLRNPLPMPVADFLHATDATHAWTAELDGRPVGHACLTGPATGFADAERINRICAAAHGCETTTLTWIRAVFVDAATRRLGIGRRLLETAREAASAGGLHPCLEVLPVHPAALSLYLSTGWQVVHAFRPDWLRAAAGDEGPDVQVLVYTGPTP